MFSQIYSLNSKKASIKETAKSTHLWGFHLAFPCLCVHIQLCARGGKAIRLECKQNTDWGLINTSCPLCAQEQFMGTTQLCLYREGTRQLVCKQTSQTLPEPETPSFRHATCRPDIWFMRWRPNIWNKAAREQEIKIVRGKYNEIAMQNYLIYKDVF